MKEITNQTLHEILIRLEEKVDRTNGNVRKVEKRVWAIGGGLVVVAIIVVPLFLDIIR